jgi:hypothetical protein
VKCNTFQVPNCHDSNRCNHDFPVPSKTCDGQIESSNKRINGHDELSAIRPKGLAPIYCGFVFERFGPIFNPSSPCFEIISHQLKPSELYGDWQEILNGIEFHVVSYEVL